MQLAFTFPKHCTKSPNMTQAFDNPLMSNDEKPDPAKAAAEAEAAGKLRNKALRLLTTREHSREELMRKLAQAKARRARNEAKAPAPHKDDIVGCYDCHSTPTSDHVNTNLPPAVADVVTQADAGVRALFTLRGTSASLSALLARVIDPPAHGRVNLNGDRASYFPEPGFVGTDSFTYAAGDGSKESELGHVEVTVSPVDCQVKARALVPRAAWPGTPVPLRADASLAGCQAELVYDWDFGDGSPHGGGSSTCRSYASVGDYTWTLTVSADGVSQIVTGVITISPTLGPPLALSILNYDFVMAVSWPQDDIPVSLEMCDDVGAPYAWRRVLEPAFADADTVNTNTYIFVSPGAHLFRVRRVP